MYEKLFLIGVSNGTYCNISNSINLNWNNNVEKYSSKCCFKYNPEEVLSLKEFVYMYDKYINNSSLLLKKSNLKLKIKNIKVKDYLEINLYEIIDNVDINHLFNKYPIYNEIIEIYILLPHNDLKYNPNNCVDKIFYPSHISEYDYDCHHKYHTSDPHHHHDYANPSNIKVNYPYINDHFECCNNSKYTNNHYHNLNHSILDHHNHHHNISYHKHHHNISDHNHLHNNSDYNHHQNISYHNYIHNISDHNISGHSNTHQHNLNHNINEHNVKKTVLSVGIIIKYKYYNLSNEKYKDLIKLFEENMLKEEYKEKIVFNMFFLEENQNFETFLEHIKNTYNIDAFICGPLENLEVNILKSYVKAKKLILFTFGATLMSDVLSKNLISLTPSNDLQSNAIAKYLENVTSKNEDIKTIITCTNSEIGYSNLTTKVRNKISNNEFLTLSSVITYNAKDTFMEKLYVDLKNEVNDAIEKNVKEENIYILFISSDEIVKFIEYISEYDITSILEKVNWIGNDKNYLEFEDTINVNDNKNIEQETNYNNLELVKSFLAKTKFKTFYNQYYFNDKNSEIINQIINVIGLEHPNLLELYDSLFLLITSFRLANYYDDKYLIKTIYDISPNLYGLTGNLSLTINGSRKYNKYEVKTAIIKNFKFNWVNDLEYSELFEKEDHKQNLDETSCINTNEN